MDELAEGALSTFCLFDLCDVFEDVALELHFDPEVEVTDGREAERVAITWEVSSLSGMLGLQIVDWEGNTLTEEFDVNGTNAYTKV